jgi:hypothetical protein
MGTVLQFPRRGPFRIEILREGEAWLVRARAHGWLHGSYDAARADAEWLANNFGVGIADGAQVPR